ncbi:cytochrome oxidase small assembly protein [Aquabacterium sp.]|nr:cytochrome oxidase small assembly protein [Aquabacterium sp.]
MSTRLNEQSRQRNLRLALILASVAVTFFVGFVAKIVMFSHH